MKETSAEESLGIEKENTDKSKKRLKLIRGGLDSTVPPIDWLSSLSEGTVFLCKPKDNLKTYLLEQYKLVHRTNANNVLLYSNINVEYNIIVIPRLFCAIYDLIEVQVYGIDDV